MKTKINNLIDELLGNLTLEQYVEECAKRGILSRNQYRKHYKEIPNAKHDLGEIEIRESDFFKLVRNKYYLSLEDRSYKLRSKV
jgi:hypothetical protein